MLIQPLQKESKIGLKEPQNRQKLTMQTPSEMLVDQKSMTNSLVRFFSGTLLSRVSGFLRDVSTAYFFGADASIAAFLVALRFATLLRRLFGEGALLNGFIPHFEAKRAQDPALAARFFRDTFFSLFALLLLLFGISTVALQWGSYYFGSSEVLHLTTLILPGAIFICLFGVSSGLLHCEKHFFTTSFAPLIFNVIWILAVWVLGNQPPKSAAVGLSIAISVAFFFQWGITVPQMVKFLRTYLSWGEVFRCRLFSPDVKKMLSALSLGVIGVTAMQINTAFDAVFARMASLEGPAYLTYAIHLQQLPLALFGVGVASVLLPTLSRAVQAGDSCGQLLEFALSRSLFVLIPCTAAIVVAGCAGVTLVYGRGHFSGEALYYTTQCLWGYGLGLIPMAVALLLATSFYARKDYKTPMICSLISIGVNLALNTVFVTFFHFGPVSLAYATSIGAVINAGSLYRRMAPEDLQFSSGFRSFLQTVVGCAFLAAAVTGFVGYWFLHDPTIPILTSLPHAWQWAFSQQLLHFVALFVCFSISFFLGILSFKKKEIFTFLVDRR